LIPRSNSIDEISALELYIHLKFNLKVTAQDELYGIVPKAGRKNLEGCAPRGGGG